MSFIAKIDESVHNSAIGRFFEFEERQAKFSVEFKGAVATFMTMAYILAVNPRILADSGGPCVAPDGAIFDPVYSECIEQVRASVVWHCIHGFAKNGG